MLYFDPSAWVKRYIEEVGSHTVHSLFRRTERIVSSDLGFVEVVAALSRRLGHRLTTEVDWQLMTDWQRIVGLHVTEMVTDRAAQLAREYRLRAADAVHLATAMELREDLAPTGERVLFVACDKELLDAAEATRFPVFNPLA